MLSKRCGLRGEDGGRWDWRRSVDEAAGQWTLWSSDCGRCHTEEVGSTGSEQPAGHHLGGGGKGVSCDDCECVSVCLGFRARQFEGRRRRVGG